MTKPKPVERRGANPSPRYWPSNTQPPYAPPVPAITGKRQRPPLHQPKEKPPKDAYPPPLPRTES